MTDWPGTPEAPQATASPPSWPGTPVDTQPEKSSGILPNFVAGFGDDVTAGLNLVDRVINPYRHVAEIFNSASGALGSEKRLPVTDQAFYNRLLGHIGLNPQDVVARDFPERLARYAGQGLGAAAIPGPGEAGIAAAGARALTGTVAATAGGEAAEAAPDRLKPVVGLFASMAAGIPFSYGMSALSGIPGTVSRATEVARAGVNPEIAEQAAGKVLSANITDLPTVKAMLAAGGVPQKVPGSAPSTFQASGDMGLGGLERSVATKNPELFKAREAEQNAARLTAMGGIQTGANPTAVADFFRSQLRDLDTRTAAGIADRVNAARTAAASIGGEAPPEAIGQVMRDAVASAEAAARQRERGLWNAVDPNGDLTGNMKTTSDAAQSIAKKMRPTEKPMSGEEAAVFNHASKLPAVAPVADLIALRSRASTAMRDELMSSGRTPSYARLVQLRGAIQDNLANTIADQATVEKAAPEASVTARVAQWRQNAEAAGEFDQQTGTGGPGGARGPAGAGAVPAAGAGGAGLPPAGGSSGAPGAAGLSGNAPQFTEEWPKPKVATQRQKPLTLLEFLASRGGISANDPLVGDVKYIFNGNPFVPGYGRLIRATGRTLDESREAAHEAGYEIGEGGARETTPSDLLDVLHDEAHGRKHYVAGQAPLEAFDREHETHVIESTLDGALEDEGMPPPVGNMRKRVIELMRSGETDPLVAYERAVMEEHYAGGEGNELGALPQGIAGWDFPHDTQPAPAGRGQPARQVGPAGGEAGEVARQLGGRDTETVIPTFDAAAAARLAAATAATKERAATFGQGPVGQILRQAGSADVYRVADAGVPGKLFHSGPTAFQDAQALVKAVGQDKANALLTDAAAASLRKAAMTEDGYLDPKRLVDWQSKNADALRALPPDVRNQFTNARTAGEAVAEATSARADALKAFQSGKVAQLLNVTTPQEVSNIIGQSLQSPTLMKAFANVVSRDPDAAAGLRQAVADHIAKRFISNTEVATSGLGGIKADAFQTFVKQNEASLRHVFTASEMDTLKAIADDIRQAKRSQTAVRLVGQSNTAQDLAAMNKQTSILGKVWQDAVTSGAGAIGWHFGGPITAVPAWFGARTMQALREAGIANIDQLVTQAMLDPVLARRLLDKVPANTPLPLSKSAMLARAIRRSVAPALLTFNNERASQ
jgi:hypothetical protein